MAETFCVERRRLMRFLGAKVMLTPAARRGHRHGGKTIELAQDPRLVHDPSVRERGQRRHALAHHGARDRRGLRGRAARLLGDRLWHRRHAEGRRRACWPRSGRRPRSWSASPRMRRCSTSREPSSATPTARRPRGHPAWKPHPMQGWAPDFIPKLTGDAVRRGVHRPDPADLRAPTRCAAARSWPRRRASSSASPPARHSPARCNLRRGAEGREHPLHAARHRRALSQHAAVRRRPRGHDRGGDAQSPARRRARNSHSRRLATGNSALRRRREREASQRNRGRRETAPKLSS